jgi:hypothetical protein
MVSGPGDESSEYAPINESTRTGTIKYLNQGASFVVKARRKDAYQQMYMSCKGKYSIVSEGPKSEGGTAVPVGGMMAYEDSQYWYITFKCAN